LITEHRVPELIPVLGSQPAGDVSHKPGGRLPLLSARLAVTLQPLRGLLPILLLLLAIVVYYVSTLLGYAVTCEF